MDVKKNIYKILYKIPTQEKVLAANFELEEKKFEEISNKKHILLECGQILEDAQVIKIDKIDDKVVIDSDYKFVRVCTIEDEKKLKDLKKKAKEQISLCREKVKKHNLTMKIFDADLSFDEKKLTFYFGAEGRVDFRQLVVDLIRSTKKTIRLQQVGQRDQARMCGGCGPCGRQICCQKFLRNMENISLETAKMQDLSTSSGKITGLCGKLMCCISFELSEYKRLKNKLPKIGTKLQTKCGEAEVIKHNIQKESVIVKIKKDGKELEVKI